MSAPWNDATCRVVESGDMSPHFKCHFAFNSKIVMEYGGNSRVKSAPKPVTFSVTGATWVGSVMEFVSSGLFAFITTASPSDATLATPLI